MFRTCRTNLFSITNTSFVFWIFGKYFQRFISYKFIIKYYLGLLGTNPASKEIEEKIEEELDWEDAGDTHEFLTEPLPSELLSETQQDPPKNNQASQGNSASKDGSEMDLD